MTAPSEQRGSRIDPDRVKPVHAVLLTAEENLRPPDNDEPIVRSEVHKGDLQRSHNSISAKLTTGGLSKLNNRVDIDKSDPADVVEAWLIEIGFFKKDRFARLPPPRARCRFRVERAGRSISGCRSSWGGRRS